MGIPSLDASDRGRVTPRILVSFHHNLFSGPEPAKATQEAQERREEVVAGEEVQHAPRRQDTRVHFLLEVHQACCPSVIVGTLVQGALVEEMPQEKKLAPCPWVACSLIWEPGSKSSVPHDLNRQSGNSSM